MSAARRAAVASVVLAIAALYVLAALRLPVGVINDDAANVLLARALLRGRWAFPGGLGAPFEFLPAFPLLLALPSALVGTHWGLLRVVPLAFAALSLWLTRRLARRWLSPGAAAAATLLTALTPALLGLSGLVLPYTAFLALSLALLDGADAETPRAFAWLCAGAAAAPLLRPQGVVLAGALALPLFHRRGAKPALVFLACAAAPAALWTLAKRFLAPAGPDYLSIWRAQAAGLAQGSQLDHAAALLARLFAEGTLGVPDAPFAVRALLGLAVVAAASFGAARVLRRGEDARLVALIAYAAGTLLLHLTWHWSSARYAIALAPLVWTLIAAAGESVLKKRAAAAIAVALACFALLRVDLLFARAGLEGPAEFEPRTTAWLRAHVPAQDRIESLSHYALALTTGRATVAQRIAPPEEWLAFARSERISWVHVRPSVAGEEFPVPDLPPDFEGALARGLSSAPGAAEAYRDPAEGTLIFRLAPEDRRNSRRDGGSASLR